MLSPAGHTAQFYDDVAFLADRVATFFAEALRAEGGAIAIVRPEHLGGITARLDAFGLSSSRLRASGRFVIVDADELLAALEVDGHPDPTTFRTVVGDVITLMRRRLPASAPLHLYGEMVDLLWSRERADDVLRLEELWNELRDEHAFELLCGYRLGAFAEQRHVHMFHQICSRHVHVSPSERHARGVVDDEAARTITELEQRAAALETEVARRHRSELRMEQLLAVSECLSAAVTREEVAAITVERGIAAVGARFGALYVPAEDAFEMIAVSHAQRVASQRWMRVPATADTPIAHVLHTGTPVYLDSMEAYRAQFPASYARTRAIFASEEEALVVLPLVTKDVTHGVLALTFESAMQLHSNDRTFLSILARQCAVAMERVRLAGAERETRRLAETARDQARDAIHARDEILSVVSHDLRNPLGTILMGASTLLTPPAPDDKKGQRVFTAAERIHRQAERMARRIDDLVDFAGIQSGAIEIDRQAHPPAGLVEKARAQFGPIASERGLVFETSIGEALPPVHCDAQRALQVFSSLVTNALKVTPRGGCIAIGARPENDEIVFFVRDGGPGIDADELPILFEQYWRSKHQTYKGAGLGLSIARGIVDAHGGRIWAENATGAGSTFYFSFDAPRGN